jgi:hypothetical protein
MLRVIAIILLFLFAFRIIGSVIRFLLGGASMNRSGSFQQNRQQKPRGGNVNVDYVPKKGASGKHNYKGGEYVDYEDVDE